ncbi:MAG: hypothetical protein AAFX56_13825 [Pseudomonadota bacterium]
MRRWLPGWLTAVVLTYIAGSIAMTQLVLYDLSTLGVAVDIRTRVATTLGDLAGLVGSYLPLLAIALGVAFVVAGALGRLLGRSNGFLYLLAGALGVAALLWILELVLGLNPLSGARGRSGFLLQMLAGLCGGYVFSRFMAPRAHGSSG